MRKSVLSVLLIATYMISISIHEKDKKLKGKQGKNCFAHIHTLHSTTTTKNEESQPQVDFGLEAPENF